MPPEHASRNMFWGEGDSAVFCAAYHVCMSVSMCEREYVGYGSDRRDRYLAKGKAREQRETRAVPLPLFHSKIRRHPVRHDRQGWILVRKGGRAGRRTCRVLEHPDTPLESKRQRGGEGGHE